MLLWQVLSVFYRPTHFDEATGNITWRPEIFRIYIDWIVNDSSYIDDKDGKNVDAVAVGAVLPVVLLPLVLLPLVMSPLVLLPLMMLPLVLLPLVLLPAVVAGLVTIHK
jgi:hypothetical protein